jgi:uncharacterized membrane protein YfcA
MDTAIAAMLFAAGITGGMLSGLVGGASLVTFPALLAAGLPPVTAAVANLVALVPANVAAAVSERSQLPPMARAFAGVMVISALGALFGAALLLLTPQRTFQVLVPLLLGFATVLLACSSHVIAWLRARMQARGGSDLHLGHTGWPMLPISIYGGYFGAGVGVLALAVLSVGTGGDYRSANVVKNIVVALNSVVAMLLFVWQSAVTWPATLVMMTGAVLGGLLAGRLARLAPARIMRAIVVAVGALLTGAFAWRYWF